MKINLLLSIFILIFIFLITGCSSNKKEYKYISTFLIYSPENNGVNESEIKIQEDYSNKIMETYDSIELRDYISDYFIHLYGYERNSLNPKVKSLDNKNTIYQVEFDCDKLEKDDCILVGIKIEGMVYSKLEISDKLYISGIQANISE